MIAAFPIHRIPHDPGDVLDAARAEREKWFRVYVKDDRDKLQFMRAQAHELARVPSVVELASRLVRPYRADDWRRQAEALHAWVRDGIRYQRDPDKREQLASPATSLRRGRGDCDDKVTAFVSLANALGMDADFWPVWQGDVLAHVQTAIRWPGSDRSPLAQVGEQLDAPPGKWIVSDPTIRGAALGVDPGRLPRNPETGRLPLSG